MPNRIVPSNEILKDLYESGLSSNEIADRLNMNRNTISSALSRLGISNRNPVETKLMQKSRGVVQKTAKYWLGKKQPKEMVEKRISKIRGENHWLWKGGKEIREYRKLINKEICEACGSKLNLGIHHKDIDHYNNNPENLQVLCVSCHMSLHKKLYWDAIHSGEEPQKSNGPIGWKGG